MCMTAWHYRDGGTFFSSFFYLVGGGLTSDLKWGGDEETLLLVGLYVSENLVELKNKDKDKTLV